MSITALPTPPQRSDGPDTFANNGDTFIAALPVFVTEANALASQVSIDAAAVAAVAPGAIAAAQFQGEYSASVTYAVGQSVSYGGDTWYAKTINLAVTPATGAYWQKIQSIPAQAGQAGKYLGTSGTAASWSDVNAVGLKSATTTVAVSAATAPTSGQVLTATSSAAATWQAPPAAFPTGTVMLFAQTAAPTGWTKSTAHDNKALRIVSGTAGSGGTSSFSSVFASRTPSGSVTVGGTTLSVSQIPAHTHSYTNGGSYDAGGSGYEFTAPGTSATTESTGGGLSHTHTGSFSGAALDFNVQYVDVIIATKN